MPETSQTPSKSLPHVCSYCRVARFASLRDLYWHYNSCPNSPYTGAEPTLSEPAALWSSRPSDAAIGFSQLFWDYTTNTTDRVDIASTGLGLSPPSGLSPGTPDLTPRARDYSPFFQFGSSSIPISDLLDLPSLPTTPLAQAPPSHSPFHMEADFTSQTLGQGTDSGPKPAAPAPSRDPSASEASLPISLAVESDRNIPYAFALEPLASTFARARISSFSSPKKNSLLQSDEKQA